MTASVNEKADEVTAVLRAELAELLECPVDQVDLDARLTELPGIDSMRLVQAVVKCEKHWGITLDEDELVEVRTGTDLVDLIVYTLDTESA
ncbi:acyl carrier protein [Nocardia sp. alder85J]|uniref:acyl carrier protein n=1 Tax=Nocardia sp. alder85J TaxID=2862949 RepID=UPI001CD29B03|nr:acyl carrier protein [Nocardia sp. alder85J]MCX4093111.1 acyl carrier protein [Nocardia sp. alder85J]